MKKLCFRPWLSRLLLAAGALVIACSRDASDHTGGKRIVLATRVEPNENVADEFTNARSWKVTLFEARLAIAALYYFDGKPAFARNERRSATDAFWGFFIRTAHAHPQHYVAGSALGEMVEPSSVDVFRPTRLADGDGVTGTFRSGRLLLPERAEGPEAEALAGHVATASGVASKDDQTVYFSISADWADIRETSPKAEVDGCTFDEVEVTADGTVTLTITPRVWFNLVDFSAIPGGSEDAATEIVRGDVAHKAFSLGVAQLNAYHFAYTP